MRLLLVQTLTLFTILSFGQGGHIIGQINKTDTQSDYYYLRIILRLNEIETPVAVPDLNGQFEVKEIADGTYDIIIRQIGQRDATTYGVKVKSDSTTNISLTYPPPCTFIYDGHPKCVNGHTDNIVPIVYGLPTRKAMKKSEKGKVYLGGCVVTACDPIYYCLTHKREL